MVGFAFSLHSQFSARQGPLRTMVSAAAFFSGFCLVASRATTPTQIQAMTDGAGAGAAESLMEARRIYSEGHLGARPSARRLPAAVLRAAQSRQARPPDTGLFLNGAGHPNRRQLWAKGTSRLREYSAGNARHWSFSAHALPAGDGLCSHSPLRRCQREQPDRDGRLDEGNDFHQGAGPGHHQALMLDLLY